GLPRLLDALPGLLGVENGVRAQAQRALDLLFLELLVALDRDVARERPPRHAERDRDAPLTIGGHLRVDLVEESHGVDRLDVLVDCGLVEGSPFLRLKVHPDRVLLDPDVALDVYLRHRLLGGLGVEDAAKERAPPAAPGFLLSLLRTSRGPGEDESPDPGH